MRTNQVIGIALAIAVVLGAGASVQAGIVLREEFSNAWDDLAPEPINVPGGVWRVGDSWGGGQQVTYLGEAAGRIDVDLTAKTLLGTLGDGVKLNWLEISARFTTNCVGTDSAFRGGFIGFSDVIIPGDPDNGNVRNNLWGIAVRPGDDTVNLIHQNAIAQSIAYAGGTFDTGAWHTLSYYVYPETGAIGNVILDGQLYAFSSDQFTDAHTRYATWYASSQSAGYSTWADWIQVRAIPEPGVAMLLGATGLLSLGRRKRNRVTTNRHE